MEQPNQPDDLSDVEIRLATTDVDAVAIHRFLLIVLQKEIEKRGCPVNAEKSLIEIFRVIRDEVALMAVRDGYLIGTMGVMRLTWWFGDVEFMTDRWDAVLPEYEHTGVQKLLLDSVKAGATDAGLKFIHQGKIRDMKDGTSLMFPRMFTPTPELHDTPTLGSA